MKMKDITDWANPRTRTIYVQSDVCPVPLKLDVRRFTPNVRDSLKRGWMDGTKKKFKQTEPFAIVNMANAAKDMKDYIDQNVFICMEYYLRDADPLIKETYNFAIQYAGRHAVSCVMMARVTSY
jgi:hypothetical protein